MNELSAEVKTKLAEAVELWADEYLVGKPVLLGSALYLGLKKEFIKQATKIEETFKK